MVAFFGYSSIFIELCCIHFLVFFSIDSARAAGFQSALWVAFDVFVFVFDGYCSTVQGLPDWFEVDLGFTVLSFIQIDLCILCVQSALWVAFDVYLSLLTRV